MVSSPSVYSVGQLTHWYSHILGRLNIVFLREYNTAGVSFQKELKIHKEFTPAGNPRSTLGQSCIFWDLVLILRSSSRRIAFGDTHSVGYSGALGFGTQISLSDPTYPQIWRKKWDFFHEKMVLFDHFQKTISSQLFGVRKNSKIPRAIYTSRSVHFRGLSSQQRWIGNHNISQYFTR